MAPSLSHSQLVGKEAPLPRFQASVAAFVMSEIGRNLSRVAGWRLQLKNRLSGLQRFRHWTLRLARVLERGAGWRLQLKNRLSGLQRFRHWTLRLARVLERGAGWRLQLKNRLSGLQRFRH
jgi:hypothetical protein